MSEYGYTYQNTNVPIGSPLCNTDGAPLTSCLEAANIREQSCREKAGCACGGWSPCALEKAYAVSACYGKQPFGLAELNTTARRAYALCDAMGSPPGCAQTATIMTLPYERARLAQQYSLETTGQGIPPAEGLLQSILPSANSVDGSPPFNTAGECLRAMDTTSLDANSRYKYCIEQPALYMAFSLIPRNCRYFSSYNYLPEYERTEIRRARAYCDNVNEAAQTITVPAWSAGGAFPYSTTILSGPVAY